MRQVQHNLNKITIIIFQCLRIMLHLIYFNFMRGQKKYVRNVFIIFTVAQVFFLSFSPHKDSIFKEKMWGVIRIVSFSFSPNPYFCGQTIVRSIWRYLIKFRNLLCMKYWSIIHLFKCDLRGSILRTTQPEDFWSFSEFYVWLITKKNGIETYRFF